MSESHSSEQMLAESSRQMALQCWRNVCRKTFVWYGFSNYLGMRKVLFDDLLNQIRPRSSDATPTFGCPSVLDGELWRYHRPLGRYNYVETWNLFTNAFSPQTGLDKTVQSQIYWRLLEAIGDCRQLTADTAKTRQSCLVRVRGVN